MYLMAQEKPETAEGLAEELGRISSHKHLSLAEREAAAYNILEARKSKRNSSD